MTKQKTLKKSLLSSIVALFVCFAMLLGTTFAWFTDSVTSKSNVIKSGTLEIALEKWDDEQNDWVDASATPIFNYEKWEPGYTQIVNLRVVNLGSLSLKWEATITTEKELSNLADAINVYVRSDDRNDTVRNYIANVTDPTQFATLATQGQFKVFTLRQFITDLSVMTKGTLEPEQESYLGIVLQMATTAGNEYQGLDLGGNFDLTILATQNTYEKDSYDDQYDKDAEYPTFVDVWDGTADTSWYNDTDTEFTLSTSAAVAGLAELVDGGNDFAGKTIKLDSDLDLYLEDENGERVSFDPIGYGYDVVFKGTFDGQGHTIANMYQNGWALGYDYSTEGGGLFASVVDATIKNVTLENAEVVMECVDMGMLVGYSYGTCTYENILIKGGQIANYQRYTGGVVGEVNGTQTFTNVDIIGTNISSLWGDFDCSIGGIVGGKYGEATLTFKDCDVACELNVYNDVTSSYQWYAYRRAGMLIGNSEETTTVGDRTEATASYLTAENCTVTYGDWADYHYCEFAGTNWPYVRVEAGYSSDAYSNPRYGVATDANGNKVVDDTHVHNDGEDHNVLLTFDQLFGGGQGVYGTATHNGVTVIYNK